MLQELSVSISVLLYYNERKSFIIDKLNKIAAIKLKRLNLFFLLKNALYKLRKTIKKYKNDKTIQNFINGARLVNSVLHPSEVLH